MHFSLYEVNSICSQWNLLGQTAVSICEVFSDVSGTNSVPIISVCWWFGSTKQPAHNAPLP